MKIHYSSPALDPREAWHRREEERNRAQIAKERKDLLARIKKAETEWKDALKEAARLAKIGSKGTTSELQEERLMRRSDLFMEKAKKIEERIGRLYFRLEHPVKNP